MSNSQLVDGKTGLPIGPVLYEVATSTYVPPSNSYPVGAGSSYYTTTTANYAVGGIVGTTVNTGKEVIKGESRIEYVPFEKKIIEYKDQAKVERVPRKVKKVEYREERKVETIPKEVTVTDYYAVEYLRQYIPQYVPEKRVEYVQVPKKQVRYEYIPVERQIVHYPDQALEAERTAGYTTTYQTGYQTAPYTTTSYTANYAIEQPTKQITYTTTNVPTTQTVYATGPVTTATYEVPAGYQTKQYYTSYQQGTGSGIEKAAYDYTYDTANYALNNK